MNTRIKTFIVLSTLIFAMPMAAFAGGDHGAKKPTAGAAAASADMTDGEVRKVDKESGKLTLKHADIKSLDMPAMTMVFAVKDKDLLNKLQPGDKVRFKAVNEGGKFTVIAIETQ